MTRRKAPSSAGPSPARLAPAAILAVFALAALAIWRPAAAPAPTALRGPITDLAYTAQAAETRLAALARDAAARPLFQASRRPVTAPAPPPPPPAPTLMLVGVLADADARMALVRVSTAPDLYRVAAGTRLGPWEILEIGADAVRVSKEGGAPYALRIGR